MIGLSLREIARALDGEVQGREVRAPGPGHSRTDRSLCVMLSPTAQSGFVVSSFSEDPFDLCRDHVSDRLGLEQWQPGQGERRTKPAEAAIVRARPKLSDVPVPGWTPPNDEGKPKLISIGQAEPKRFDDEARRHRYMRDGLAVRVKVKRVGGSFTDWYRVRRPSDGALGWQAAKPVDYVPTPYIPPDAPLPFAAERRGEIVTWSEGEKDADALHAHGFLSFTFGGASDVPDCTGLLDGHHIVIVADNDSAGEKAVPKKIEAALSAGAASVKVVRFPDLPKGGDAADFFAAGRTAEDFLDRAERIDTGTWRASDNAEDHDAGEGRRKKPAAPTHGSNESLVTEDEGAILFAERHRGQLRYCHDHGAWFVWTEERRRRQELAQRQDEAERARIEREAQPPNLIRTVMSEGEYGSRPITVTSPDLDAWHREREQREARERGEANHGPSLT